MGSEKTTKEINEAVARKLGWKLDAPISMIVAGEKSSWRDWIAPDGHIYTRVPDYCHDIKAAWEILEYCDGYKIYHGSYKPEEVTVTLAKNGLVYYASSDTAPMAICLALLKLQ